MEKISESKFDSLNQSEMSQIEGGGWNVWKTHPDSCGGSYTQRHNWFGLHGTSDLD